ncbi:MAG: hypothetical protein RLY97_1098, partial [Pseudomonadota bacterium]
MRGETAFGKLLKFFGKYIAGGAV